MRVVGRRMCVFVIGAVVLPAPTRSLTVRGFVSRSSKPWRKLKSARSDGTNVALRISQLLFDPVGRGRERGAIGGGSTREATDPMMFSHAAFVPGILVASSRGMMDLASLQLVLLTLSLMYHRNREVAGRVALVEGSVAKAFFVYGIAQLVNCPPDIDLVTFAAEIACSVVTVSTYVATNLWPATYERYHPIGLHLVPGLWSFLVALNHLPLYVAVSSRL
mmetsp:Transcript_22614/g.70783  ORF Transcript_22614/g.70783 Transcript_22614/m.70783 type:complete len:220 (+) Transcript_22614:85-744(+)